MSSSTEVDEGFLWVHSTSCPIVHWCPLECPEANKGLLNPDSGTGRSAMMILLETFLTNCMLS